MTLNTNDHNVILIPEVKKMADAKSLEHILNRRFGFSPDRGELRQYLAKYLPSVFHSPSYWASPNTGYLNFRLTALATTPAGRTLALDFYSSVQKNESQYLMRLVLLTANFSEPGASAAAEKVTEVHGIGFKPENDTDKILPPDIENRYIHFDNAWGYFVIQKQEAQATVDVLKPTLIDTQDWTVFDMILERAQAWFRPEDLPRLARFRQQAREINGAAGEGLIHFRIEALVPHTAQWSIPRWGLQTDFPPPDQMPNFQTSVSVQYRDTVSMSARLICDTPPPGSPYGYIPNDPRQHHTYTTVPGLSGVVAVPCRTDPLTPQDDLEQKQS